jgi:hypothetical protein
MQVAYREQYAPPAHLHLAARCRPAHPAACCLCMQQRTDVSRHTAACKQPPPPIDGPAASEAGPPTRTPAAPHLGRSRAAAAAGRALARRAQRARAAQPRAHVLLAEVRAVAQGVRRGARGRRAALKHHQRCRRAGDLSEPVSQLFLPVRPVHQGCLTLHIARARFAAGPAGRPRASAARHTARPRASARTATAARGPGSRARGRARGAAPEACCRPSARGSAERRESGARRKRVPWCACASAARCSSICSPSCARRARGRSHKQQPCVSARAARAMHAARVRAARGAAARATHAHSPEAAAWRTAAARLRAGDDQVAHHRVRLRPLHLVLPRRAAQARPRRRAVQAFCWPPLTLSGTLSQPEVRAEAPSEPVRSPRRPFPRWWSRRRGPRPAAPPAAAPPAAARPAAAPAAAPALRAAPASRVASQQS